MVRALKGLKDAISISIVHPTFQRTKPDVEGDDHTGWVFKSENDSPVSNPSGFGSFDCAGCIPDTINGAKTLRDLYEMVDKDYNGRYTVPVLWDKKTKTIVSNESSEIVLMLNNEFNEFAKNKELELSPSDLLDKMKEVDTWIYDNINNGVYKCGFAQT
jgi:putative glutathione S-transferase